jgi:hypothetical protein
MLSVEDELAIHDVISLYGHIIDDRQFSRTHEIFTADALYDVSDFNAGIHVGWRRIAEYWQEVEAYHPLAHHATNVIVTEDDNGTVRVLSKGIGMRVKASPLSAVYRDVAVRTADGWRLSERIGISRSPNRIPAPS